MAGAGSIGCHAGGLLAAAGRDVTLLGRPALADEIGKRGLTVIVLGQPRQHVKGIRFENDAECLAGAEVVLVAVKSGATEEMAARIAAHAPKATVVSLQNGVSNPEILRAALPDADVRGGVVSFNVIRPAPGAFRQTTSGGVWVEDADGGLARVLDAPGLPVNGVADIRPVQWGKLLVNLNNALNALSGLPLVEQLQDRRWRRLLADQMAETLQVLGAERIRPARFSPVPPWLLPHILRLPTPVFRRIARAMLTIDPAARSSMQDDLRAGRRTEIDAIQGEVLGLAARQRRACPAIECVVAAIRTAEAKGEGPPILDPDALRAGVRP